MVKVIPNNLLCKEFGASQSTAKGKHLTKVLHGSYQQGKGYLGGVLCDYKNQKLQSKSYMWSYKKVKYISGTQCNNR